MDIKRNTTQKTKNKEAWAPKFYTRLLISGMKVEPHAEKKKKHEVPLKSLLGSYPSIQSGCQERREINRRLTP